MEQQGQKETKRWVRKSKSPTKALVQKGSKFWVEPYPSHQMPFNAPDAHAVEV